MLLLSYLAEHEVGALVGEDGVEVVVRVLLLGGGVERGVGRTVVIVTARRLLPFPVTTNQPSVAISYHTYFHTSDRHLSYLSRLLTCRTTHTTPIALVSISSYPSRDY